MLQTLTATHTRIHFGDVLRSVTERGKTVLVERAGKPEVVILSHPAWLALVEGTSKGPSDVLEEARRLRERLSLTRPHPDRSATELLNSCREDRSAHLTDLP